MEKQAKIYYLLSEEGRKKSLLQGGNGKELQEIETIITEDIVKLAKVKENGDVILEIGCKVNFCKNPIQVETIENWQPIQELTIKTKAIDNEPYLHQKNEKLLFDDLKTVEELVELEKNRVSRIEEQKETLTKELEELHSIWQQEQDEKAKLRIEKDKKEKFEREERVRQLQEAKVKREQEKSDWIKQYGSDYLKDCLEMNVSANLEYVVERAAKDYPEFVVDYADNAKWEDKFSPSPESLSELKKIRGAGAEAEIIWLTRPAKVKNDDEYDEDDDFESCEAILIHNYLGKFDLVKTY